VTVETLLDCEGSFATVHEAFPAVDSDERWVLPINCVLGAQGGHNVVDRAAATRRRFLGELADEDAEVIVSHFHGRGRFERSGKGFRWAVE
jgi:hypothetical protein